MRFEIEKPGYRPWRHRFAIAFVLCTFVLIMLGGTVTSKGVGLAVPDWPTTYNYNMFLFPPSMWTGGIFWEHTHRLMGSLVGLMAIGMAIWLWQTEGQKEQEAGAGGSESPPTPVGGRRWLQWFGIATLLAVTFQGIMGGLRVTELSTTWAVFHGITAQLVFCMTVLIAAATSRWWIGLPKESGDRCQETGDNIPQSAIRDPQLHRVLRRVVHFALIAIFIQLALGATLRHNGAGLAIPDFPLAYGKFVPPLTQGEIQNAMIAWSQDPETFRFSEHGWYSPFQVAIHWTHRLFAIVAFVIVGTMAVKVRRGAKHEGKLRSPATAVGIMLVLQVALGASVIWTGRHPEVATAHQTLGAILFATTALILFRLRAIADCTPGHDRVPAAESATPQFDDAMNRRPGLRRTSAPATQSAIGDPQSTILTQGAHA